MKYFLHIILCIISCSTYGQEDSSFMLLRTIKGDIADFTVDNLNNIYIISSKNQIKKINAEGDSIAIYNDVKKFGQLGYVDVSNPLKTLIYYRDFSTIVMLDRFLNIRNTIDLRQQNIFSVRAISQSYDNKIWIYDEQANRLKKIDEDGKVLLETPDFRQLFIEGVPVPQRIFDHDRYVYLYDAEQGVFVFDYYGTFKNKILITRWQNFKASGNFIFGSNADTLHRYEISTYRLDQWKMPGAISQSQSFNFTSTRLFVLKNGEIEIYSYR